MDVSLLRRKNPLPKKKNLNLGLGGTMFRREAYIHQTPKKERKNSRLLF